MLLGSALFLACADAPAQPPASPRDDAPTHAAESAPPDPFSPYLTTALTDGFSHPVDGWRSCGEGCWTAEQPRTVRAIADGEILPGEDGALRVRHRWLHDERIREITATYHGVSPIEPGNIRRGEALGTATQLRLHLDGTDEPPGAFIDARPTLFVPRDEARLALVSREARELRIYVDGVEIGRYPVAFGQVEGDKAVVKDRKTPMGTYFIVQRSRGPFDGWYADYYGGIWLRLNYPNAYDAARGVDAGLITPAQQAQISRDWRARRPTLRETKLGGGIGVHAWAHEWDLDGDRALSWGCLVVQPADADAVYTALPEGTMVILF